MAKRKRPTRPDGQQFGGTRVEGAVTAERDAYVGSTINNHTVNQIIVLLRQPETPVRVEQAGSDPVVVIGEGAGVRVTEADLAQLVTLQRQAEPARREDIYLTRFILGHTYAQWERQYLPLAGQLLDAPLRITDRYDPAMSGAGEALDDLRDALTQRGKTRLVIVGDPGAGKTTTLERLALDLARERLRDPRAGKLPLRVDLFEFTAADPQVDDFLRNRWETTGLAESYGNAVAAGQVCFLLDGLNQMPLTDRAKRLTRWSHWARESLPPGNWAVFTCRSADYVPNLRLPEVRVQSLDEGRMRQYVELRLGPERAPAVWATLVARLHAGDDRFERLARNPFMLSRLVERAAQGKALTDSRAVLMNDLAQDLISRELEGDRQPETLTADPHTTLTAAMEALGRLAFAMQLRGEGTSLTRAFTAEVPVAHGPHPPLTWDEVLDLAVDATVLECAEGQGAEAIYAFYHHLLQEYFAAREFLRQFRAGADLAEHWRVGWRLEDLATDDEATDGALAPAPTTGWEETITLAAALAGKDTARLVAAVAADNLPLAGRCLAEAGPDREEWAPLVATTRTSLLARQRDEAAHLRARIEAGLALGEVGHPDLRPQVFQFEGRAVAAIVPPLEPVPAGAFIRGSDSSDSRAFRNENTTERQLSLATFRIGRYPVTNAEFKLFVDDRAYATDRWWSDAGQAWKRGGPEAHAAGIQGWLAYRQQLTEYGVDKATERFHWHPAATRYWQEVTQASEADARQRAERAFSRPFDRPAYWDDPKLNRPARPVVGVNWYEAEAYCAWLTAVTGQPLRLPDEMEWKKAARGLEGREYPWGKDFEAVRCNTVESRIDTTTPVGLYPTGMSLFGVFDGSGNVWEWTADWYQVYPGGEQDSSTDFGEKYRCVRGGSWCLDPQLARCASRYRFVPDDFDNAVGFRVLSPVS